MDGSWGGSWGSQDDWLEYDVVDVFTDRTFAGNQLAVVHGAAGLHPSQLKALAQEFNLSETAFPTVQVAGGGPSSDYDLRIFTPQQELPFAGHPSIGAAWALRARGLLPASSGALRQRCAAGVVSVEVGEQPTDLVWLTGGRPTPPRERNAAAVLAIVGLGMPDLVALPAAPANDPVVFAAGTGLDFAFLLVHSDAVDRAVVDLPALRALRADWPGVEGVVVACWQEGAARVRVFTDDVPGGEDPATGSAALGLGVVLVRAAMVDGERQSGFTIAQGAGLGRPSLLHVRVDASGGTAVRSQVGGGVALVARGRIRRPSAD